MTNSDIQQLAAFVHGTLFGLHLIGAVYNIKRKNIPETTIHAAVGVWDLLCVVRHLSSS